MFDADSQGPDAARYAAHARALLRAVSVLLAAWTLSGCANTAYYWQSVSGHWQMLQAARPVQSWLGDAQTSAALKERLRLTQQMRDFAVTELALPDNPSYRRFADLQRRAVVWNVVAAQPFSLSLKDWCFPLLGCVTYRGYFDEAQARQLADELRTQGLEVAVHGVPAYSTLGWMNWAGGDPLLNTFIRYPEGELARLIFHELAHQVVYARDDTTFNESYATAVGQLGGARWLASRASQTVRSEDALHEQRRKAFRALARATRGQLQRLYDEVGESTPPSPAQLQAKQDVLRDFRERYSTLKVSWGGYSGYDLWVTNANNASFGAQAAYDAQVPAFEALFEQQGRNWPAFYDAVKRLAAMPPDERNRILGTYTRKTETNGG
ncbi:MAG: aminopeptidase [Rhodoferax sp.]|nr:aminopeptidase [Rhodoferax sp.]